jgi:hypothetical protein
MNEDEIYMTDPRAKTIEGFIAALEIFLKYMDKTESSFLHASHDLITGPSIEETCVEDSENGKILLKLGWHVEEGEYWAYFT